LTEFWYGFQQQYREASKAAVPQSFPFSTTHLGEMDFPTMQPQAQNTITNLMYPLALQYHFKFSATF